MTIETVHEDMEALKGGGRGLESVMEQCYFCKTPTRYWHLPKNEPVCQSCSIFHNEDEIK